MTSRNRPGILARRRAVSIGAMPVGKRFLLAFAACFLAACQPTPEERLSRAEAYFSASDYRSAVLELRNALQGQAEYPEARFLLGRASYQLADFESAQVEFEKTLSQGLDQPDVWEWLGKTLLAQGDATGVIERVEEHLDTGAAVGSQYVLLGNTYLSLGNVAEARRYFELAEVNGTALPHVRIGFAVLAARAGDLKAAEAILNAARQEFPDSDDVWRASANYFRAQGRFDDATAAYDKAIGLETGATPLSDRLMARVDRISLLLDAGEVETAKRRLAEFNEEFRGHPLANFFQGRIDYVLGDYKAAQNHLQAYLAAVPDDLRGYAMMGAVNFSQNHLHQAELYLQRAAQQQVGGDDVVRLLAETQLRLNKPQAAWDQMRAMGWEYSTDPALLALYGRAQLGLGNSSEALKYLEQGVRAAGDSESMQVTLAGDFFAAGEYQRAAEILEAVPEFSDPDFRREVLLMAAYVKIGDKTRAVAVGEKLLSRNPDNATIWALVGVLSQELGSTPDARKLLRKALAIDSGNTAANYALGALEIGESNPDAALPHLLAALETTPTFMPALAMLAANYQDSHASQEIEDRLAAAIAADPDALPLRLLDLRLALEGGRGLDVLSKARAARDYFPEEVYLTYFEGTGYQLQGNTELAMANLRSAARKSPENPQFQYALAGAAFKAGESRVAREAIDRYRMLRPDDYRGVSLQALILEQSGKTDDALQLANAYAARRPQDARAFLLQGNLAFAQADYSAAEASFEAAAALEWSRDAAVRLAGARLAAGHENAAEPLQRWLAEHVDDSDIWRLLGQYLEEAGDIDGAVQAYEEVVDVGGDDAIALNNLAWQYALDGNRDAIALAERAHELAPDNGSVSDTLGWVLHLLGEHEQALEFLTLAAEQTPDDPDIQYRLAVSYAKNGNNAQAKAIISGILNRYESFQSRDDALDLINTL